MNQCSTVRVLIVSACLSTALAGITGEASPQPAANVSLRAPLRGDSIDFAPLRGAAQTSTDLAISRFARVDDRLFRGAQPDEAGFRRLKELGVRTIVNLRVENDETGLDERKVVEALGMRYVHLPIRDGNFFTWFRRIPDQTIREFFKIVDTAEPGAVFVHCRRGADRTGAMVAFYRVARNGWEGTRASREARHVGLRSWYRGLKRQIEEFAPHVLLARQPN